MFQDTYNNSRNFWINKLFWSGSLKKIKLIFQVGVKLQHTIKKTFPLHTYIIGSIVAVQMQAFAARSIEQRKSLTRLLMKTFHSFIHSFFLSFFLSSSVIYPPPMQDLHLCPETYNLNARVSDACSGSTDFGPEHKTNTHGRVSMKSAVSRMSGSPPETIQDRTQRHTPSSRIEIKIPDPAGNRTRASKLRYCYPYRHAFPFF